MRAKRSKKYRKIMANYNLHFSFRTPYQVLCDGDFLRQCHAFHMPVAKSLSNTLHGDARPYVTQCSLAKAVEEHRRQHTNKGGRGDGKPVWLPPPMEVPLRYCKHKDAEGNEVGVIGETECLVDLVGGQVRGNEVRKNKNHYVLATAEELDEGQQRDGQKRKNDFAATDGTSRKRKRGPDVRELVRQIPGVPVVYVKRSVMVLEELSGASEKIIRGVEKDKLKSGLIGDVRGLKRKRDGEDDDDDSDGGQTKRQDTSKTRRSKKVKEPNPLSVKKKKVRPTPVPEGANGYARGDVNGVGDGQQKKRRKRKRGKKGGGDGQNSLTEGARGDQSTTVDAES